MSGVQQVTISEDDGEVRLDRWFRRHYPDLSFGQLQKLMRKGEVRVDGKKVKTNARVEPGQVVRVPPFPKSEVRVPREKAKIISNADAQLMQGMILHMDEQVIALNKPPGLAVQGGTGTTRHIDGMLEALKFDKDERPKLVHRLDKDTSGVLLLARTTVAATKLAKAFKGRDVQKTYWAIVVGVPEYPGGTIRAPLAKMSGKHGEKMIVDEDHGDSATTEYRVVEALQKKCAWLEMEPLTGRTHQLRAHCLVLGTPILGDGKYGGKAAFLDGFISKKMHLHAHEITIPHPNGSKLTVTAPMPDHMQKTFEFLGLEEKTADE